MKRFLSRWMVTALGTALLAGTLWVFGPLWPPLEPMLPRVVAVQSLFVLWAALNALADWRRRSRDAVLAAGLSEAGEESAAVAQTLRNALAGAGRRGRTALTELPWYAIIGPPGAGKTTALLNAGLRFTSGGRAAVPGVGGTRLCDWWFTETAVLIDTAGRYTTQDSDAAVDKAGWTAFLSLLKRTRPSQPLNGVLVAIGLPDVVEAPAAERDAHAAAIHRRIAELETRFGRRLPVYALFTKADLVAGFTEFFDDLDAEGRAQVWGETFPLEVPTSGWGDRFAAGFRTLAGRVSARMLPRLGAERRMERSGAIAGFPTQFASLEKPLAAFVGAAFPGGTTLRGVYFTSGTQEGTPMDRLTGAMARVFGVAGTRPASLRPEAGRSYFLGRLLADVVFSEANLVREAPGARRRRLVRRTAGFVTVGAVLAAAVGALCWGARDAERQVAAMEARLAPFEQLAGTVAADPVTDGDLRPLLPVLDDARALPDAVPAAMPAAMSAGLVPVGFGQAAKLEAGARAAYRNGLQFALLPRLVWRLETEIRGALADPNRLYELTRIYLMLGGAGPLDPAPVRSWVERDWRRAGTADGDEALTSLLGHLDRLLAESLPPVPLDGPLVEAARKAFQSVPVATRVYATIQSSAAAAALPAWRPIEPLGLAGTSLFTRASGKPMTDGIPGFFTARGYRTVLTGALAAAARQVAAETWVVGRRTEFAPAELQQLERDVSARYFADFTARWDLMLNDLNIAPVASLPQTAQALYILVSPESPLRALLRSIVVQVLLPEGGAATARYAALTEGVAGDGTGVERALRLVADMQQQLAKIAALPVGTAIPAGGEDIGNAVQAEAARQPQPFSRWLSTMAASATAVRTGNARRQVSLIFNAPAGPAQACAAVTARYPFNPAGTPLSADEFARVFGPAGALDGFLNTQLKPYLDTAARPWKPQAGAPLTPADAAQFQRAASIRDTFFGAGLPTPSFPVEVMPLSPRPATMTVAGMVISSAGPRRATALTWPPPGANDAEAALVSDAPPLSFRETGFWALHRLFGRGRMQPAKPGHQVLAFGTGPGALTYDVSGTEAFLPGLLADFRCPAVAPPAPPPPPAPPTAAAQ